MLHHSLHGLLASVAATAVHTGMHARLVGSSRSHGHCAWGQVLTSSAWYAHASGGHAAHLSRHTLWTHHLTGRALSLLLLLGNLLLGPLLGGHGCGRAGASDRRRLRVLGRHGTGRLLLLRRSSLSVCPRHDHLLELLEAAVGGCVLMLRSWRIPLGASHHTVWRFRGGGGG